MDYTLHQGDCLDVLPTLAANSIHCVVTSPPYWGLRDYGTAKWEGGDAGCDHKKGRGGHLKESVYTTRGGANKVEEAQAVPYRDICGKCGARRIDSQLGLEPTPEAYVARMVEVFREVRRVLRDDGTLWLNLGDSYAGSGPSGASYKSKTTLAREGMAKDGVFRISGTLAQRGLTYAEKKPIPPPGLKSKDLVGIPWRVAFALQADGWYLRQDIIWHKPNPMPESVKDRCTKAHEYVFLLSKSGRYFFDSEAMKEPSNGWPIGGAKGRGKTGYSIASGAGKSPQRDPCGGIGGDGATRNRRSVWTVATQPYKGAHFATMPPDLVEPCILAGCPVGGTVLDPFAGSGTVGAVACKTGRQFVGIELNPDYILLAKQRIDAARAQWRMAV